MLHRASVTVLTALATWLAAAGASAQVTLSNPVESPLAIPGQGLCVASAASMSPSTDFGLTIPTYNAGINAFMENQKASWTTYVQRTIFDLSNNDASTNKASYGDFTNSMVPACQIGGCPMYKDDTLTSYASRFRGFLNVTQKLANLPNLHIGFYADDAVSLTVFDSSGSGHPVITQAPVLGAPTWRMTEQVTFTEPGLYPHRDPLRPDRRARRARDELLHRRLHRLPARRRSAVPIVNLSAAGFTLFDNTAFFQTLSGEPSFPDLASASSATGSSSGRRATTAASPAITATRRRSARRATRPSSAAPPARPAGG